MGSRHWWSSCWLGRQANSILHFKCNDRVKELVNKAQLPNSIYLLEGLAVVVGLTAWASLLKRSHVVSFVDNEGVLGFFLSCKSSQDAFCPILSALVNWEDELQTYAWFDYVPSEAKIVDPPSRGETANPLLASRVLPSQRRILCDSLRLRSAFIFSLAPPLRVLQFRLHPHRLVILIDFKLVPGLIMCLQRI